MIHNLKGRRIFYILAAVLCVALLAGAMLAVNVSAASYTNSYSVEEGSSTTISQSSGSGHSTTRLTISSFSVTITEGDNDGVTVAHSPAGSGTSTTSLTVTGVTAGTVATITVEYSNGDTGTYTVTVTGKTYSDHIDLRLEEGSFEYTETTTESTTYSVTVNKVWNDSGDHSNDSVTVYLVDSTEKKAIDSEGNEITATLNASNDWTYTWEGLSLEAGTYEVEEGSIDGYASTTSGSVTVAEVGSTTSSETVYGTITITSVSSLKYTHNGNEYDLGSNYSYQNGNDGKEYTFKISTQLTDGDVITVVLSYTVTYTDADGNVLKDEDGNAITKDFTNQTFTHTVAAASNECGASGYDFHVDPTGIYSETQDNVIESSVTVTNTPSTVDIPVIKTWSGDDNYTGIRPSSVTVTVYDGDTAVDTLTLSDDNDWSGTFEGLPEYDIRSGATNATKIEYTVKETDIDSRYEADVTGDAATGYTITNTLKIATVNLTKTVSGNMGDTTKKFTFAVSYTYTDANGTEQTKSFEYSLSDEESLSTITEYGVITVPYGATVTITESDNSGYDVTATVNSKTATVTNSSLSFTVAADSYEVVVDNYKSVDVDTGVVLESIPYIAILAVVVIGGVVLLRRRSRDED